MNNYAEMNMGDDGYVKTIIPSQYAHIPYNILSSEYHIERTESTFIAYDMRGKEVGFSWNTIGNNTVIYESGVHMTLKVIQQMYAERGN